MDAPAASRLDQVLYAARTLPQPFTKEALVVRTWELYPARFGLAGFSHPDANAVYVALAKLIHRRDLVRECASVYTLSPPNESSMARSSSRTTTPSLPPPEPVALTDAELYRLQDLAASPVLLKSTRGQPLTIADARVLWGATPYEVGEPLAEKIRAGDALLQKGRRAAAMNPPPPGLPTTACVTLASLSTLCTRRFGVELEALTRGAWTAPDTKSSRGS